MCYSTRRSMTVNDWLSRKDKSITGIDGYLLLTNYAIKFQRVQQLFGLLNSREFTWVWRIFIQLYTHPW